MHSLIRILRQLLDNQREGRQTLINMRALLEPQAGGAGLPRALRPRQVHQVEGGHVHATALAAAGCVFAGFYCLWSVG